MPVRDVDESYDVIVVGAGPVGLALAVELGRRGVRCAVVERHVDVGNIPKGQNLTPRTLEHFYFWGCLDELRAARVMPPGYPIGTITTYKSLTGKYWYVNKGHEVIEPYYFQKAERLPQYLTEAVLRARVAQLDSVDAMYGWRGDRLQQDEGGVTLGVCPEGGEGPVTVLRAPYLVGCDGARSSVRSQLGIEREGSDFGQRMALVVFRSRQLHEALRRFPDRTTYRVLRPELKGYWQFFGRVDVGEGWFFHAPHAGGEEDTDPRHLLWRAAGFDFDCEIDYVGSWDLRVEVARHYQSGRCFIAGDAAHSHPPYGGFGLNSGLEDVCNLGWKLAAMVQGWGGPALLGSYSEERQPVFRETGEAVIANGIERDRVFLDTYDPDLDEGRFEEAWQQMADSRARSTYEPHYEGSSVVSGPEGRPGVQSEHSFAARPGHHLSPQRLTSGCDVFEELGDGFTLLAFGVGEDLVDKYAGEARSLGIPLKVVRDTFEEPRTAYDSRLVLVRPDQFVAWSTDRSTDRPAHRPTDRSTDRPAEGSPHGFGDALKRAAGWA